MEIPADLKILSLIYEMRSWYLAVLALLWFIIAIRLLLLQKRIFFLWLLLFPFGIHALNIAATYCGWHYRMELRERFGKDRLGININVMPPAIRAEYARHNYHPRFRDIKVMAVGGVLLIPVCYILGGGGWLTVRRFRRKK